MTRTLAVLLPLWLGLVACSGRDRADAADPAQAVAVNDSGGPLLPEQAAYDVRHYRLELTVDPEEETIDGALTVRADLLEPLTRLVLDLDARLDVQRVSEAGGALEGDAELAFERQDGRLWIALGAERAAGSTVELRVEYGGRPRVAPRPPWEGGFTWGETPSGAHWIATSNQGEGADLWWPCKDHPSDEPDSMDLVITVPDDLVCATNGRLVSVVDAAESWRTFHWRVSTPINNYTVALNIAPYQTVEADFTSPVTGQVMPVTYWVLPENVEKGEGLMVQILEHLAFMEELFGPYPFRADKYGVVETPHLGMEHQTIIAYGNQYRDNPKWGYDWLHHHELAHEWWANMVTAPDWNDFWIHEGFGTYAQNLYVERLHGDAAYRESLADLRGRILNRRAVAPREPRTSGQMYFVDLDAPEGERQSDSDIYFKGAWVLHTLRYLIGDEAFFELLRRFAYPTAELERVTDGSQCRFATTDDFLAAAEAHSGMELDWFFEVYLRQPVLPRLVDERERGRLLLHWEIPEGLSFPMPVEVLVERRTVRVPMEGGRGELSVTKGIGYELDPETWILRADQPAGE